MSNTVNNYTETDLGNISLNPRGEYDDSAAYEYLDTVSYRGGSYFCLAELETTITGIAPDAGRNSEYWQMIAAPGDMTPEYTAAHNDVIKKAVQVETSRAAVELAQQEIEAVQTDVQQLHSDTARAAQETENSKNSAANFAQSAEQSRKTVSESEQNIKGQIAGFDSRVSEAVEQSKEEINTTKQQAINTITNQQTTSVNTVKTEGEKIITRVGNDAKTVADDRATVEEATQTVLNNAQEVAQNTQTVASNTEKAAASAEGAKTSADNAAQSAKSVEDASKQIEQNKKDVDSLKEDVGNLSSSKISKFYATNNGENHLADSDDGKIADMMVYGKSEQKSTTGAQLFDMSTAFAGWVGDDGTPRNDGTIGKADNIVSDYIPVEGNAVYACNNNNNIFVWEYDSSKTLIKSDGQLNSESFTTSETAKYIVFAVSYSSAQTPDYIKTVMFNKGSSVLPWEPYTGGQPSPSPDYPQEIKNVVNPTVKVCGNNFYPGSDLIRLTKAYATDFIPVILHKKKIRISFDAFSDTSNGNYLIKVQYFDANKERIGANGIANEIGNNISHVSFELDGRTAGNNKGLNLQNVLYVKITFDIYNATATEITYKNIMISATDSDFEPYKPIQTVTLPYALNAIPVSSDGNVTINGQQYVADYVDVEREKLVRMVGVTDQDTFVTSKWDTGSIVIYSPISNVGAENAIVTISSKFAADWSAGDEIHHFTQQIGQTLVIVLPKTITTVEQGEEIRAKGFKFYYVLITPIEIDLTTEEITTFKALATYYPTTNISVNSEQLDGYTVFNYPISMENGWNYVKKQLNDNRDYIYDMDTRTQDMDIQAAEAYVNSEYAVALTELEV
nr:MAG TPA: hypothetical protein [Caudoviricetes sp.]